MYDFAARSLLPRSTEICFGDARLAERISQLHLRAISFMRRCSRSSGRLLRLDDHSPARAPCFRHLGNRNDSRQDSDTELDVGISLPRGPLRRRSVTRVMRPFTCSALLSRDGPENEKHSPSHSAFTC